MNRHVLSVLVTNHSGVLSRVAGLFSRRGYNIDSLSVGVTENPEFSRMTIVARGNDLIIDQITKQLNKLVDVIHIIELKPEESVYRELALIKISAKDGNRAAIIEIVGIFRANIIDVSSETLTVEITGDQNKVNAFLDLVEPYGVKEIVRTGLTALERGSKEIKQYID
ncbi:acetolactate synthase small subunit [Vallitalea sp.]|jgi:acetolactate synthase-1/3 small subunit|uniref:acetolactate synthase small subunit n=1 Tax=Vallitalea sp. TaxID=1882829 RepID=UPI0025F00332|nr:acetolactate synthase small subunit [Vallitalea sp.]MCT4687212.1 acetolactate synthase small subunit [Vallitalea sp.]